MAEPQKPGGGRGRGALLRGIVQRREAEAKKTEVETAPETPATPASVGHGRPSPVQQVASSATSVKTERTTEPSAETKPSLPMGRGRGFKPKIKPVAVQSAPPDTSKLGKVVLDDAESFRSEEFETSSRIGTQPFDAGQLAEKLTKLQISRSESDKSVPVDPSKPTLYRGLGGKPTDITVNYIRLTVDEGYGMFEYECIFEPRIDSRDARYSAVNQHKDKLGQTKSFDGQKLFLPKKLDDPNLQVVSVHNQTGEDIKVTFRYKRQINPGERESLYLYNVLFKKIMRTLKFAESAKRGNFFDPQAAKDIKEYKLSIWPGYVTAADVFENGLYLQLDVAHRVLRCETVMDIFFGLRKKGSASFQTDAEKALLGQSVITKYNNRTYKIDGIDFDESPKSEFVLASGEKISFMEYYKRQYSLTIKDPGQPLLINRPKIRGISEAGERIIKLVPEMCFLTGMTDAMRADFKIMKEVGAITRMTPAQRQDALNNFMKRVTTNPDANQFLRDWGLTLDTKTVNAKGRILDPETICFGKNYREAVRPNADWGRSATSKNVLTAVPLNKWAIVFVEKNEMVVRNFCKILQQQGPKMGIPVTNPRVVKLKDDRTDTYLKEMRNIIDPSVQLIVTIFPQMKSDRYAAIKKLCCVEMPVASQVINLKTISNDKRLTSVVQKVALQINCKLGGELWACTTPFKDLMVVGIDVYHDTTRKTSSYAGVVGSMNDAASRYYSVTAEQKQGQEIMDALRIAFIQCLIKYWECNRKWPANVVVFRDGVGDGQLEATDKHEAEQFMRVFNHVRNGEETTEVSKMQSKLTDMLPEDYSPGFVFVVVQKRINTRILECQRGTQLVNPAPGTVLDHTVTRFKYKDFFLVPQSVNQGTVSPTHFIVLKEHLTPNEGMRLDATGIQKLAYKLTHMYYNWPGTVRVPAPVQYAHKLVDLVGQHVHRIPANTLQDRLFYL